MATINTITLPCDVGSTVYIVEDYSDWGDRGKAHYLTKYGTEIKISTCTVDCFIVDDEGVSMAEDSHDGAYKLVDSHRVTLDTYQDGKVFFTYQEAYEFVKSVCE